MSHIFISYSRKDRLLAQEIVDALAARKMDAWIDWDSRIYLYDLGASRFTGEPALHTIDPDSESDIGLLAYSPDGRLLASVDRGGKVVLWDTSVYLPIDEMETHFDVGWFSSIRFLEDSSRLLIGQHDGDPDANDTSLPELEWIVSPDEWVEVLCDRVGRNLIQSEWDTSFQGETYRATCGQYQTGQ